MDNKTEQKNEFLEIYKALAKFQNICPEIEKDCIARTNTFSYKYASLPNIKRAIKPALKECDLVITHMMIFIDKTEFLVTKVLHVLSGDFVQSSSPIPAGLKPQEKGAQQTYLSRYHICGLLAIAADEDVDGLPKDNTTVKTEPVKAEVKTFWAPKTDTVSNLTTEKKTTEKTQTTTYINDDYVINFGKHKGKSLDQVGRLELESYVAWLYESAERDGKSVSKNTLELEEAMKHRWSNGKTKIEVINIDAEPPVTPFEEPLPF